ncbi:MAG: hemolysin family protein [Tissierellia bacterium]|nr:hemolysin family protein [Tissierellia bacterium]
MTDSADAGSLWPQILLIVVLTMINAFFSASEMAYVSINKNKLKQLEEEGDERARLINYILSDQTKFLSTIQVGITLAGFLSSGSAAINLSSRWASFMTDLGIPYAKTVAFVTITMLISYISLVFGELVPKRIALRNAEKVAMSSAKTVNFVSKIFTPIVKLLSFSTSLVLKLTGNYSEDLEEKISEEEIKSVIRVGRQHGLIDSSGQQMIISIFDFDDKLAYEIMTPRTQIFMIDIEEFSFDTIKTWLSKGFSRVPVYRDNQDNIIGTVYLKDLFSELSKNNYQEVNLENIIKPAFFVPESKKIDSLLNELQNNKSYMALLFDEYGVFSGIVTMEDIVEEIVGEIADEYDDEDDHIRRIDAHDYILDGSLNLSDINEAIGVELNSENHETISGMMIELLGYIPEDTEKDRCVVDYKNYTLRALGIKDKRIDKVRISIHSEHKPNLPEE